jgi:hypothetical protein
VKLLADDRLGAARERVADPVPACYLEAFRRSDPRQKLIVVELDGPVMGCLQLTIIPGLSHQAQSGRRRGIGERASSVTSVPSNS